MEIRCKNPSDETAVAISTCEKSSIQKTVRMAATEKVYALNSNAKFVDGNTTTLSEDEGVFVFVWEKCSLKVFVTKSKIAEGWIWNASYKFLEEVFELCWDDGEEPQEQNQEKPKSDTQEQTPEEPKSETQEQTPEVPKSDTQEQTHEEPKPEIQEVKEGSKSSTKPTLEPKLYTEFDLQAHKDKFAQVIADIQEELRVLKEKVDVAPKEEIAIPYNLPKKSAQITITPTLSEAIIRDLAAFDRKSLRPVSRKERRRRNNNKLYEEAR